MSYSPPKYHVLKQHIIKFINSGNFEDNNLIPSEHEFMKQYSLSRITVRKAIDELVNEGYLYKIQGKGTYVKGEKNTRPMFSIRSCTEDIRSVGMEPSRITVSSDVIEADMHRIRRLELTQGDKVFRLVRVYFANSEPVNYTTDYLPIRHFPSISNFNFNTNSLYEILKKEYNCLILKSKRTMEAVLAMGDVAKYLEVKEGHPLILFRAVTYGKVHDIEIPIETFKCYYRTDKISFEIHQQS